MNNKAVSPFRSIPIFLIAYQAIFLLSLPFYLYFSPPSLTIWIITIALYFITGLSITAGYHRLYAHRAYKAHPFFEAIILFFGTLATQASVIRWSFDHRLHHAHVDTDEDPYSIKKGFWYAHFLWLMEVPREIEKKLVSDLFAKKMVAFQHRHYLKLVIGLNTAVFIFFGWLLQDWAGSFVMILWGRMFALHHSTWFINSLAHTWGDKPFSQEHSAVNNYVISLLTFGEGYHNYHHTYANDYRNGIRWYHFDPTKWLIWAASLIGITKDLKKIDDVTIEKRMVIEHKRLLSDRLKELYHIKCDELEAKIESLSEQLLAKIAQWNEINLQLKLKDSLNSDLITKLSDDLSSIRSSMKKDLLAWKQLSNHILSLPSPSA